MPAIRLAVLAGMGLPILAAAQIVADPNAGANRPGVIQTANGLPQVNITRPTGAGVSINQYTQFDVNKAGAILNNSPGITNTQQAGYINGNPNLLPGGAARIIVNQINSTSPSQLRGYLEVAGQRADVVIANPNGLLVDGAGFINTSRVTLTTGMPIYGGSGSLDAFRVTGGQINIEGGGLNAAGIDQVDLIARAVKANAAVYANRLNVVAGANQVDYNTLATSAIAGTGPAPSVGIDVSQLGGMYANKILLASTEQGVGVSLRGVMAAQAGDMTLNAQGKLVLASQTNASGNLAISARDGIDNSGTTYAAGSALIRTDGTLTNSGTLAAQRSLDARAREVASTGTLAAGVNADGTPSTAADLAVTATGAVSATGRNQASGNAAIQGASVSLAGSQTATNGNLNLTASAGNLDLTGATTSAGAALTASAQGALINDRGQMSSQTGTSLTGGSLSNQGGQMVSQGVTAIQSAGAVNNAQGSVQAGGALTVNGASLDNTGGRVVSLNGDGLKIQTTGTLTNAAGMTANGAQGGVIGGNGNVQLTAGALVNHGQVNAQGDATVNATSLNNDSGTLSAGGALTATVTGAMSSRQGTGSGNNVAITAQSLDNTSGKLEGGQLAIQTTGDLINQGGSLKQYGQSDTTITAGGKLDNTSGTIAANGQNLTVNAASLTNNSGQVSHAGAGMLAVTSQGPASNAGGVIQTNGALTAQLGSLNGAGGTVSAQKALALTVQGALDNTNATLHAGDALTLQTGGALNNAGGRIESAGAHSALAVSAASVDNTGGRIANAGDGLTQVTAQQQILNAVGATGTAGLIGGNGALALNAGTSIVNQGSITARGDAVLNAQTVVNDIGSLTASGGLSMTSTGATSNRSGLISAATTSLSAASLDNAGGWLDGDSVNVTTTGDLSNRGGTIKQLGLNDTTITAGAKLDNTSGTIVVNGANLAIGANTLVNDNGSISHAGTGTLAVTSQGTLSNAGGAIQTNGSLRAQAATLDNSRGTITAQGSVTAFTSGNLDNRQGSLYGQTGLTLASGGSVDNTAGSAQTAGNLSVVATGAVVNQGGTLAANGIHGQATISATSVDNTRGMLINAGDGATAVTVTNALTNTAGKVGGNGDVTIAAKTLANNTNGTAGGQVAAGGVLGLNITSQLDNRGGTLYGQSLTLNQTGTTLNNAGGQVLGGTDVKLNVASLSNLGGAVKANQDVAVAGAVSGSGTMIAGRDLTLNVAGDYTNDASNLLRANGNMRVAASGTLTNTGALAAAGALTVSGTNVVNAVAADINSSNTTVTASNLVSNAGRIEGDTVQVSSPTMTNTGTVIGNNVQVQGTDIVNNGPSALMAAVGNLKLYATNSVQNLEGATLYSAGNLQIARDGTRDPNTGLLANQVNTLINRSANIEADGDIDIAANQVSNTRTSIVTTPGTPVQTAVQTLTTWFAGLTGIDKQIHGSITFPTWSWASSAAPVYTQQINALRTPITVTVDKSTVTNLNTANQTLSFTTAPTEVYTNQYNCDFDSGPCTRPLTTNPTQYYQSLTDNGTTYSITLWPDWNPNVHIRPDQVRQANFGHDYNEISRTTVTMTATDQLVSATAAAKIQAGGNIRINSNGGNILNQSSTMAAGGNLVRVAANGGIQDVGTVLQQTVTTQDTSTFYWHQQEGGSSDTQVVALPSAPQASTTVMALPAIATANQTVQTTAQNVTVASVNAVGATVTGSSVAGGGATGTQVAGVSGSAGGATAVSPNGTSTVTGVTGQARPPQTLGTAQGGIPNLKLPTNGLYTFRKAPGDTYLVATDSRFTQYTNFISSDYMLNALGLDPQKTQKRLGDGFYEEKLIRDQVTQLTGRTFLAGYTDQLEEYKSLMNNGVTYAKTFNLTPGVGLTDEQMRQLTTDMVWMVSQDVTLPDGTTQSVLAPKVYLAQGNGVDLKSTGALVAGNAVFINATGNVDNSGSIVGDIATQVVGTDIVNRGSIGGTGTTVVKAAQDVRNLGGRIGGQDVVVAAGRDIVNESQTITNTTTLANGNSASATGIGAVASISGANNVAVLAGRDISMAGGTVNAGGNALLAAGRDLNIGAAKLGTTQDATAHGGQDYLRDQTVVHQGSTVQAVGNVTAVAGRDATLTASAIEAGGDAALVAGRNTTATAAMDTRTQSAGAFSNKESQFTQSSYDEGARGASVQAGNNATLGAGQAAAVNQILQANGIAPIPVNGNNTGNVAVLGSSVSTGSAKSNGGAVKLVASGDVTVGTVTEQHNAQSWSHSESSGFLSKTETTKTASSRDTVAVGSVVSGDTVVGSAGRDMTISGSTVAGTHDVSLEAGRNLTIATAESMSESHTYSHTKATGFGATGGGISYGMRDQKDTTNDSSVTQTGSLVGSTDGNVSLKAGSTLRVTGSQVIAAKDLKGVGADVIIEAAKGSEHHDETHEIKQTGFTLGVSGGAIGSAINAGQKVSSATKSQDGRASALWGIAAGRDAFDAAAGAGDAMKALEAGKGPQGTAITLSFGTSKSKSTFTQDSTTHTGSSVKAGGTATFTATGMDADGNKTVGNLDIVGSNVSATKVGLAAKGDVNIVSATDTSESHSTNKSSSGSIGVSYGTQGFGVSVSASTSKGNSDSTGTTQVNSHVTGSESVSIVSGNDTNILGGVVSGGKVSADVGGNLNLASRQDTEESHARQQSVGGGLSFSQGGGLSGSFSASKGKADGTYTNVTEQSGIRAGDGGFDINVKGNTDLKGAVIASTATSDKNKLTTGTLSWSDIENKSDYSATSLGVSGGFTFGPKVKDEKTGQTSGKNTGGVSPMIPQHESGSQRGMAQSGISEGTITITDGANQKQDVATLNRDTSNTNTTVGKNPDINNVLGKQADMMAAAQAAGEAVAKTIGDIADKKEKAAKDALKQAEAAYQANPTDANRAAIAEAQADIEGWKESGEYRAALHAAGGAMVAGLGGGNAIAGAVGAGLSSLAAEKLGQLGKSVAGSVDSGNKDLDEAIGNLAANLAAGGLGALVGGGSGAATAANADRFNRQLSQATPQDVKTVAAKEAEKSGMTPDQLEKAMSVVLGTNYDERGMPNSDGITYDQYMKAQAILLAQPANSPLAKEYADAMRSVLPQFAFGDTDSAPNMGRIPGFELARPVDPIVVAQGTSGGKTFTDTNQNARASADPGAPTLINDRIVAKIEKTGNNQLPNGNMATAHAEIGVIEQASAAGKTKGQDMTMKVVGRDVCDYCKGDIPAAAAKAGLNSVTINAIKNGTNEPITYYWKPGMKSLGVKRD